MFLSDIVALAFTNWHCTLWFIYVIMVRSVGDAKNDRQSLCDRFVIFVFVVLLSHLYSALDRSIQ